ncbi:hypothetical protein QA641_23360 [Bradyrhizobium sp. CB1650]|uniref:hypothetical protein n=1 Tax=Bradyrhizobium sp. CB1650 TaxID=3039153 RepID=UPI002435DAA6|nr:hypothetical protein [Bradyrhizobium sp. CB1650]WGD48595.1 hypothetical protein QA641_23360 [Bradyrhizobium sp. CB1650]
MNVQCAFDVCVAELRATGMRDLIVFCQDCRCSHNGKLTADYVDRWPDDVRLSELEPWFVCKACGKRGAIFRGCREETMMAVGR